MAILPRAAQSKAAASAEVESAQRVPTDNRTLAGKVAIVTGASSGIGAATAKELARRGAQVVLAARREYELELAADAITAAGGAALAIPTDIADPAQVTRLVERTIETFGQIDVLVNNAGIGWMKLLVNSSLDDIRRVVDINLLGAMLLTRAALPHMLEQDQGTIITISSVCGRVAVEPLYSATKYGIRGFTLALRRQLVGANIAVSLVDPGNIRTPMTADIQEPMTEPQVVANAVVHLILHPRREVVVPPKHYAVILLEEYFPGIADFAYRWRHRHGLRQK